MKKTIKTLAFCVAITVSITSCKKTYECHCDKVVGGDEHFEIKAKKGDAESNCKAIQASSPALYSKCHLE